MDAHRKTRLTHHTERRQLSVIRAKPQFRRLNLGDMGPLFKVQVPQEVPLCHLQAARDWVQLYSTGRTEVSPRSPH